MMTKEIIVCGEAVAVHSLDGVRWFSDRDEAERFQRQRETFLTEQSKLIKRHATFMENFPPKRRAKR